MVRTYGDKPYKTAVLHGGPGALGSLACVGRELADTGGVLEPLQSKHTVTGLVEELACQLEEYVGERPITLLGHSWGAWLAVLFAARYPRRTERLILVGCGPLEDHDVPQIAARRLANLTQPERGEFQTLIDALEGGGSGDKDRLMERLGQLAEKADNVQAVETENRPEDVFAPDGEMYTAVWDEARGLRASGALCAAAGELRCPVFVLHGESDPHPADGVVRPLLSRGVTLESRVLPRCGHSPFIEKYAREPFYDLVRRILAQGRLKPAGNETAL